MTKDERLRRLECAVEAVRFPTTLEYHNVVAVASDDRRSGQFVIEQGNHVTFFASSAQQYQEASRRYAGERHIIVISVDPKCVDFEQEVGAK